MSGRRASRGFTLIELLVVISIIAVLISILLPALGRARDHAKMVICRTRLVELYRGHALYADENRGFFPHYDKWLWPGWAEVQGEDQPDSVRWVENGQIFKYLKNREVYFCPKDNKDRVRNTWAIGSGGQMGEEPIHSFVRLYDPHYRGEGNFPAENPDYIEPAWLRSGVFTPPLGNRHHQDLNWHPWVKGTPVAQYIVLMYEEHQGIGINAPYQLNDGWSSPEWGDLMSTRHDNQGHFLFWDGHIELGDSNRFNRWPADGYARAIVLGGAKPPIPLH
jgi:prepilin-type N-terminal cleavage/methylation domain-containing protein/prepilin-type processing-associated H-X9-DG protein